MLRRAAYRVLDTLLKIGLTVSQALRASDSLALASGSRHHEDLRTALVRLFKFELRRQGKTNVFGDPFYFFDLGEP